jgi:type IV pilus assembly protein PilQ
MTAGLLFCAAASVYSSQAVGAKEPRSAKPTGPGQPNDVKVLEDPTSAATAGNEAGDPFAPTAGDPSTQPSTQPGDVTPTEVMPSNGGPAAPLQMNSDGTFSLNIVNGADLVEQLRVIGFQAQMSVIPSKEVRGALPAVDLYNVTVTEALDALLHSNGYAWRQKGNFIHVYSAKELEQMEKAQRVMNTEVFRVYYTPAVNAVNMIKPVLSSDGQVSLTTPALSGIESGVKDMGGNSHATDDILVVSDFPENLDRVRAVLREIDRRPQQILIEATIMRATLSENNKLGVDFNILGGVDFSSITSNSSGQIVNAGAGTISPSAHSVGTGTAFSGPIQGGLKVGIVTNNVSVFVAALEGVTDTVVMANPKVLALNKQKGEVIVGRKDGYLTTTLTDTTATQTVEFLDTGTRLIFRPFIGDDGYIRMEVHPEDSSGGLNSDSLPFKVTTEVTSNVMVKDGHTIVIGGLFRESTSSSKSQIPIVGNLPLVGHLFKNQADDTVREEVIILLTPHIVKDDSVYSQLSEQELKHAEQMRVGARRGLMFWGRERMANLYYDCALKELSKRNPDRKKAIFYLNAATGLVPTFSEAIDLKQDLTGRELTAASGSSVRGFVRRTMLVDHQPTTLPADENERLGDAETSPATQPFAFGEPTTSPSTQPQDAGLLTSNTSFEFGAEFNNLGGFQPATQPTEGFSMVDPCDECEAMPLAETDMESPSYDPGSEPVREGWSTPAAQPKSRIVKIDDEDAVRWITPTTHPVASNNSANGPSTQPTVSFFGVRGLGAAMAEMMKQSSEQSDDTTVTEVPMEELPGDNK